MVQVRAIRSEDDYGAALARIAELVDALSGTEGQVEDLDDPHRIELDVLTDLVELYEDRHHPMGYPDPISAIKFRMEQANLSPRDLVPFIGSRAKVSEVLSGKRTITMSMARALHQHLGIPADVLLQEPGARFPELPLGPEYTRFPLAAMAKEGWIPVVQDMKGRAEELVKGLMDRAGVDVAPLYRKNDGRRINAKADDYALRAWCWQALAQARERESSVKYQTGTITFEFLRDVAQLSVFEDGPIQARTFLAEHGVGLQYVKHLPRTYLDGAALMFPGIGPVIGLTLRYDRIDSFWFTLLHELSHLGLHMGACGSETGFVDDHTLRGIESVGGDAIEQEADELAQDALIPPDVWNDDEILDSPGPMAVMHMAWEAQVHPAIVAGRVRYKLSDYRRLSQFVGAGEVRRQFEEQPDY